MENTAPMTMTDREVRLIRFPSIGSPDLGYITVAEVQKSVPFEIKRVYWTYYTPQNVQRGGHAHKTLMQIIFAVNGRIQFSTETADGKKQEFILEEPYTGLFIPPYTWRDIKFSHNAVLLSLASEGYEEADYIRDYKSFQSFQKNG